jgi:hypothetical protein
MPRPRKEPRGAPPLEALETMSNEDLHILETRSPGMVTTSDHPDPWYSTPRFCGEARRLLLARGVYDQAE